MEQTASHGRVLSDSTIELTPHLPWEGLHVFRGQDYSSRITIRHLLSQTSGLADYFLGTFADGTSLEARIKSGQDIGWNAHQALNWAKELGAACAFAAPESGLFPVGRVNQLESPSVSFQLKTRLLSVLWSARAAGGVPGRVHAASSQRCAQLSSS